MTEQTPWSTVGYLTYKRTYSREVANEDRTEEFSETIDRIIGACRNQLSVGFTSDEEERLRGYLLGLKGSVAGRFMWQLGTQTVERLGLPSLQNCAFTVVDHPVRPFTWAFDMLMLGSGVGFNIQREFVYKLPPVRETFIPPIRLDDKQADFIVPDTREGWVQLLHHTLKSAFFEVDGYPPGFTYSTQLIRGRGAKIAGFGGVASGPEDLVRGIEQISKIIINRSGTQLRPIDCLDIMNIIGSIVVAGNVRRCLEEGTFINTNEGLVKIEDIDPGKHKIVIANSEYEIRNKFDNGEQEVSAIKTSDGEFRATENHRWLVYNKETGNVEWIETQNLRPGVHFMLRDKRYDSAKRRQYIPSHDEEVVVGRESAWSDFCRD